MKGVENENLITESLFILIIFLTLEVSNLCPNRLLRQENPASLKVSKRIKLSKGSHCNFCSE